MSEKKEIKNEVFASFYKSCSEITNSANGFIKARTLDLVFLPYDGLDENGNQLFITNEHKSALHDLLFTPSMHFNIEIISIVGYSSAQGDSFKNLDLAKKRAMSVYKYIEEMISIYRNLPRLEAPISLKLCSKDKVKWEGESRAKPLELKIDSEDNGLDRKVEINYILKKFFSTTLLSQECSELWKISFDHSISLSPLIIKAEIGVGTLSMLLNDNSLVKQFKYLDIGVTAGIPLGKIAKLVDKSMNTLDAIQKTISKMILNNFGIGLVSESIGGELAFLDCIKFSNIIEIRTIKVEMTGAALSGEAKASWIMVLVYFKNNIGDSDLAMTMSLIAGAGITNSALIPDLSFSLTFGSIVVEKGKL